MSTSLLFGALLIKDIVCSPKTKELPLSGTFWQFWAKIFLATFPKSDPVGFQEMQKYTSGANFVKIG